MKRLFVTVLVALFATVVVGQTKKTIKPPELPPCVSEWIKLHMKDYTVDKAYRIDHKQANQVISYYYARLVMGQANQWMYFDDKCMQANKISANQAEKAPPKPYPPTPAKPVKEKETKKETQ